MEELSWEAFFDPTFFDRSDIKQVFGKLLRPNDEISWKDVVYPTTIFCLPESYQVDSLDVGFFNDLFFYTSAKRSSTSSSNKEKVLVKKVQKAFEEQTMIKIYREVLLLTRLRHPNIITLLDKFIPPDNNSAYLVYEWIPKTLRDFNQPIDYGLVCSIVQQILVGLEYLHKAKVVHRNISPTSILVVPETFQVKLTNFDYSTLEAPLMTGDVVEDQCYRAPEVLLAFQRYTQAIDVWSVGCIIYELYAQKRLFTPHDVPQFLSGFVSLLGRPSFFNQFVNLCPNTFQETTLQQEFGKIQSLPENIAVSVSDLVEKMLNWDPKLRISAEEALSHSYFKDCTPRIICEPPPFDAGVSWF
eukprot:Lithocolla_globosa_v1_NODE_2348_length_2040_cov_6.509320.p1 type:complete len:357 gc:universal NODE_2348_length_2040_cov_6.509320:1112-42(-)